MNELTAKRIKTIEGNASLSLMEVKKNKQTGKFKSKEMHKSMRLYRGMLSNFTH